jgi:hypothetical protein
MIPENLFNFVLLDFCFHNFLLLNFYSAIGQNISKQSLSATWKAIWSDGVHGRHFKTLMEFDAEKDLDRYIDLSVPMDLNKALQEKGIINDPNIGVNSFYAR